MPATPAWLAAVEGLLNRGITASMEAVALARRLDATAMRVDVEGLTPIRVSVADGRLALIAAERSCEGMAAERVDATIEGSPFALLQLARDTGGRGGANPAAPRVARAAVGGDAEIANSYRQLFALARPDIEEEVSRIIGDVPARRLSLLAQQALAWARRTRRTAGENIAEYLQEESRDLVSRPELEEFLHGVDSVRETVDRVEARLSRIERRLKGSA
jgi:ubiquinone biosynthesis protein UbiJ